MEARHWIDQMCVRLPRVKITELLMEVDGMDRIHSPFHALKTDEQSVAVDDDSCRRHQSRVDQDGGFLSWYHLCRAGVAASLAYPRRQIFAKLGRADQRAVRAFICRALGDGTTSSSDGQRFKAGGRAESTGHVNPKYGSEPGRMIYTHISGPVWARSHQAGERRRS